MTNNLKAFDCYRKGVLGLIIFSSFNNTNREKLFYSIHCKNGWSAAFDLFDMFTQSMKFYYTFYYHALIVLIFENCDSLNRQ